MKDVTSYDAAIAKAAEILRRGGVVAFPTETVYGLGADASSCPAVQRIFDIKGRPATNPLIVHVPDAAAARRCVAAWPPQAELLAKRFWPGPLTIVLPKSDLIAHEVTAGGPTVGLRVPDHPTALALLRAFATPESGGGSPRVGIAAPSANRSTHVSPTTAQHVLDDLGSAVDFVLDGGPCTVGIESTVVSLATQTPVVLRPGGVSLDQLRGVIGEVQLRCGSDTGVAASPGRMDVHYRPDIAVELFEPGDLSRIAEAAAALGWEALIFMPLAQTAVEHQIETMSQGRALLMPMPSDAEAYANRLYAALREAERLAHSTAIRRLLLELPPDQPQWQAIRDRLSRMVQQPRTL